MPARRPHPPPGSWPAQLDEAMAAAFVGETTVKGFRSRVGRVYPEPVIIRDLGPRWLTEDLQEHLRKLHGRAPIDAADVL